MPILMIMIIAQTHDYFKIYHDSVSSLCIFW